LPTGAAIGGFLRLHVFRLARTRSPIHPIISSQRCWLESCVSNHH
jgi:hypothetical protein